MIYCGSLSKTLAPGLRVGFMVAAPEVIEQARALRRLMYRHPPTNTQRTVGHFLALGHHDSVILKLSQMFKQRCERLVEAMEGHLAGLISAFEAKACNCLGCCDPVSECWFPIVESPEDAADGWSKD